MKRVILIFVFLGVFQFTTAQVENKLESKFDFIELEHEHSDENIIHKLLHKTNVNDELIQHYTFSDINLSETFFKRSSNINCSGGFCMIHSHYHKKGLTRNRQYFDYFMKIWS